MSHMATQQKDHRPAELPSPFAILASPTPPLIYLIWSGTTHGESHVVGYAKDLADAWKTLEKLSPVAGNRNDEIRTDWPRPGVTEILRTWFDKEARITRWLRATPTFHAIDCKNLYLSPSSATAQI
jgi:hypothetical protein